MNEELLDREKISIHPGCKFLDHGVEKALSQSKVRRSPIKRLPLSIAMQAIFHKKRIKTIGQLLLQEELKWRNPRSFGNILVNEILIALSTYLNKLAPPDIIGGTNLVLKKDHYYYIETIPEKLLIIPYINQSASVDAIWRYTFCQFPSPPGGSVISNLCF